MGSTTPPLVLKSPKVLRLKRVEISGFKSFYEKVDLAFPGSVTAVVGPNGCGKSNISDAVAWALGEQSARVLRGETMDDVIFNGSAKRRPLGMAEVILTLAASNGDSEKGDDAGELRVGRRVYRDGEGEYFLNDKQVRLRDIQDQLLGTGLGVRAYSVIEQGRIDQVLSTKPQDRRRLIEEAAGITKYKLKKRLAEGKLEADPIEHKVAAISCGIYQGTPVLDLDYAEDSTADADANFVLIEGGKIAEAQATAEGACYDEESLLRLLRLAQIGCAQIFKAQDEAVR